MRLRRALLVTTAVSTVLLGGAGMAYAQSFDWSGFYVGVGVGAGMGTSDGKLTWFDPDNEIWSTAVLGTSTTTDPEPFVGLDDESMDFPGTGAGFGIGGSVGFNAQMDNFLFGIEASIMSGPFAVEDKYVESGTVSFTTSATTTLFGTTTGTTFYSTVQTTFLTTEVTSNVSFTHTLTVTNPPTTTTLTSVDTYTTFQTTVVVDPSTTIEYPTSTTVQTTVLSTTGSVSNTTTTATTYNQTLFSTGTSVTTYGTNGEWTETITGRAQIDWLATIKGRIGITADRTLFFATGGLAIAGVSQETTAVLSVEQSGGGTVDTVWHGSNDETRFGFVVGGGIEQALDDHWIVSGEFEYFNLGTAEYDVNPENNVVDNHGRQTQVLDGGSVKFGVKYKF